MPTAVSWVGLARGMFVSVCDTRHCCIIKEPQFRLHLPKYFHRHDRTRLFLNEEFQATTNTTVSKTSVIKQPCAHSFFSVIGLTSYLHTCIFKGELCKLNNNYVRICLTPNKEGAFSEVLMHYGDYTLSMTPLHVCTRLQFLGILWRDQPYQCAIYI